MSYTNLAELMLLNGDTPFPKRKHWKVWVLNEDMKLRNLTVPAGFMTDFASIPRVFRSLFSSSSAPWQRAAVLHDYMYSSTTFSRKYCDRSYLYQSRMDGTSEFASTTQYVALRLFGWLAFRSNQKKYKALRNWRFIGL